MCNSLVLIFKNAIKGQENSEKQLVMEIKPSDKNQKKIFHLVNFHKYIKKTENKIFLFSVSIKKEFNNI